MKYLCDACANLVDVGAFQTQGGALALTCPSCGAVSSTAAAAPPSLEPDAFPPDVEALWARLVARWDDDALHARALVHAEALGLLAELGRHYRERAQAGDDRAARRRDAIVARALSGALTPALGSTEAREERLRRRNLLALLAVVGLLTVIVFVYLGRLWGSPR